MRSFTIFSTKQAPPAGSFPRPAPADGQKSRSLQW
jgi:hypothetical protein